VKNGEGRLGVKGVIAVLIYGEGIDSGYFKVDGPAWALLAVVWSSERLGCSMRSSTLAIPPLQRPSSSSRCVVEVCLRFLFFGTSSGAGQ
jgi:hypothetical protein